MKISAQGIEYMLVTFVIHDDGVEGIEYMLVTFVIHDDGVEGIENMLVTFVIHDDGVEKEELWKDTDLEKKTPFHSLHSRF